MQRGGRRRGSRKSFFFLMAKDDGEMEVSEVIVSSAAEML